MSDAFQEIEQEVRRDRIKTLVRRYWKHAAGAAALAIAAAIAVVVIEERREAARLEEAAAFGAAVERLEAGQDRAAAEAFRALAADADAGYAVLSQLREAKILADSGERDGAVAAYDALAGDSRADDLYRDLARLFAAELLLDSAPAEAIEQRLSPMLDGGAFRPLARELMALAYFRAGDAAAARTMIEGLADDPTVSANARARIQEMLDIFRGAQGSAS